MVFIERILIDSMLHLTFSMTHDLNSQKKAHGPACLNENSMF